MVYVIEPKMNKSLLYLNGLWKGYAGLNGLVFWYSHNLKHSEIL